ncbi:MAG: hypothetical protein ACRETL_08305, partial [Gammaproteobacteria bacterium]
ASNAGGTGEAVSVQTGVVVAVPPPPPPVPVNTVLPSVSGVVEEGQLLSAARGSWSNLPVSFGYQWEDCNSSGGACVGVVGAVASTYRLGAGDVGHTVRVVVRASNAGGTGEAVSVQTGVVVGEASVGSGCFGAPHLCGYPDESNTGPEGGHSLTEASGTVVLSGSQHYENKRLLGNIVVAAGGTGVVIKNDEILTLGTCGNGSHHPPRLEECTGASITFEEGSNKLGATGTVISHDRIGGTEPEGPNTVQECVRANAVAPFVAEYDETLYCAGFKTNGGAVLEHDYCPTNYTVEGEHYECVADDGPGGPSAKLVVRDDTLFNPHGQTAAIFLQGTFGSIGEVRIENNFLAGGGYTLYGGEEEGRAKLTGPVVVSGNRFARCLSSTCPDAHGYFPEGGRWHSAASLNKSLTSWSGNYWDDNLATVPEE